MSVFEFEDRTCVCGKTWSTLTFWADDMPCGDCSTRDYNQRIADINAAKPYRIESIGGACPTLVGALPRPHRAAVEGGRS